MVPKNRLRQNASAGATIAAATDKEKASDFPPKAASTAASTTDTLEKTNNQQVRFGHPIRRWVNKTTQQGMNKLRRKNSNEPAVPESVEKDLPEQPVDVTPAQDEPEVKENVRTLEMNPTLEFLLHDTTNAIAAFVCLFSLPTLRYFSLVVQGQIPTSVHISWLCMACRWDGCKECGLWQVLR